MFLFILVHSSLTRVFFFVFENFIINQNNKKVFISNKNQRGYEPTRERSANCEATYVFSKKVRCYTAACSMTS